MASMKLCVAKENQRVRYVRLNKRRAKTVSAMASALTSSMNMRAMGSGIRQMTSAETSEMTTAAVKQHFSMALTRPKARAPQL